MKDRKIVYKYKYRTPEGFSDLWMNSDGEALTALWFEGSRDSSKHTLDCEEKLVPVFERTIEWLDIYFSGKQPDFVPDYRINNATPFRMEVIRIMLEIPFGETDTYGNIAKQIAEARGIPRMSAQAVGGAVGWNPIGIIIPCHRVMGAGDALTGYGGGLENKIALLALEKRGSRC